MKPPLVLQEAEQIVQSMGFDVRDMTGAQADRKATNQVAEESPNLVYTWVDAAGKSLPGFSFDFGSTTDLFGTATILKDEAIRALESRVATLKEEVAIEIRALKSRVATLEEEVAIEIRALKSRVATLEEEVAMLKTELKERPIVAPVPIYDLGSAEFDLRSPVTVLIEKYEEETVARFPELELHGIGRTEPEAMAYLKKDFVELYLDLESTPTNVMGRLPSRWWALLQKLVVKHGQAHS